MTAPRLKRSNRGGGHQYLIDGEAVDGVTKILNGGIPKGALVGWAANTTAGYAIDHWDELAALTPSKRLRALQQARFEQQKTATARGSAVHAYAAQLAAGELIEVPDDVVGLVDSYLAFIDSYGITEVAVESPVAYLGADPLHRDRYAGTLDLIARAGASDVLWLIDWKTGASGVFPEVALQLAAYAHADLIQIGGVEQPMPKIDAAAAVWLRADGFDVYPVDISDATFRTFQYAQQIHAFTSAERGAYVRDALTPPAREQATA